ncbi:hypothetical protein AEGHOMDF_5100 [Methylobacterium soli]|nr:hypothetical protein AEGHOMDF_5100 [Methylobacterium soli]
MAGAAQERDVEAAPRRRAGGGAAQGLRLARAPLHADPKIEGARPQEARDQARLRHPDLVEEGQKRRRDGGGNAAGDPPGAVRVDPARQLGVGAREIRHVEAVDDEAAAVRLDARRDGAVAGIRARGPVAHVPRLDGQADVAAVQARERVAEGGQRRDVDPARRDLGVEAPACGRRPGGVAGIARDARLAEPEAQVAQGEVGGRRREIAAGLHGAPVEQAHEGPLEAELAQVAADSVRGGGLEGDLAGEARAGLRVDLAAARERRRPRRQRLEAAKQEAASAVEGAGELEGLPILEAERQALHREVEVEHHRDPGDAARHPAGDQGLAGGRDQEGVEIDPARLQAQPGAPVAQVDLAGAREAHRLAAGIDLGIDALEAGERPPRLELAAEGEGQVGAGGLGRRPDHEAGRALGFRNHGAGLARTGLGGGVEGHEGDAGIGLEARLRVAAARDLHGDAAIRGRLAAGEAERYPAARALDPPGPGQGRGLHPKVLGADLIGAPGGGHQGRQEELLDAQVLDGEIAPAQGGVEVRRQQDRVALGHRQLHLGPADPGLGEADLALEQRRQGDLGLDEAGVQRGLARLGPEMQPVEAQARRGQEPHLDAALAAGLQVEGAADRAVDARPQSLPVDDGRDGERRDEDQDDGARERGQDVTHRVRSASCPAPQGGFHGTTMPPPAPDRAGRPRAPGADIAYRSRSSRPIRRQGEPGGGISAAAR